MVFESFRLLLGAMIAGSALLVPGGPQHPPDFSGHWAWISTTDLGSPDNGVASASGAGAGSRTRSAAPLAPTPKPTETKPQGQRPLKINMVSGVPFNCGRECTLAHTSETLMVGQAYLGSQSTPAPAVTLPLDGRQASVVDSYAPWAHIPMTARWVGGQLVITSSVNQSTTTQHLSLEGGRLVVITTIELGEPRTLRRRVRFTYERKK